MALLLNIAIIAAVSVPFRESGNGVLLFSMWSIYTYLSVYISKFIYFIFSLLADLPKLWHSHSWMPLRLSAIVLAVIVLGTLWWGALINRFNSDVKQVNVEIANLPDGFEDYKIVQISDLHTGTYGNDTAYISSIVDRINSLNPDMIVFTGDIVNSKSNELLPHVGPLSRLSAPDGVYSILGNHDYGDYSVWPSDEAKKKNLDDLKTLQKEMGWDLILNSHRMIHHQSDSIALIGVENVGDPPFHTYGNLSVSYPDLSDDVTKILLSHNPAHWCDSIADDPSKNIALTLSGHTHAMQMEIAGFSPAVWRYRTWGGMYNSDSTDNALYVNIGIGTVGLPARIGATPEITLLTLKKK
ncbi:MAG: metallophosphoesterase [Lachnoclostridium sp.]|nr:metallophosphoesterase [Lachnoclostridium sp.]